MTNILDGRTILNMQIADDRKAVRFITDNGEVIARTDAECCSDTWIENIDPPAGGFPAKVLSAEDINMPDLGIPNGHEFVSSDHEFISYYGFKIVTDKGDLIIDYRNESNGYYGGNLSWPDDRYFYGGVYGQNISSEKWEEVKS